MKLLAVLTLLNFKCAAAQSEPQYAGKYLVLNGLNFDGTNVTEVTIEKFHPPLKQENRCVQLESNQKRMNTLSRFERSRMASIRNVTDAVRKSYDFLDANYKILSTFPKHGSIFVSPVLNELDALTFENMKAAVVVQLGNVVCLVVDNYLNYAEECQSKNVTLLSTESYNLQSYKTLISETPKKLTNLMRLFDSIPNMESFTEHDFLALREQARKNFHDFRRQVASLPENWIDLYYLFTRMGLALLAATLPGFFYQFYKRVLYKLYPDLPLPPPRSTYYARHSAYRQAQDQAFRAAETQTTVELD